MTDENTNCVRIDFLFCSPVIEQQLRVVTLRSNVTLLCNGVHGY